VTVANGARSLRERPLKRSALDDFVTAFSGKLKRHDRVEGQRFRCFAYDELTVRDKLNLDTYLLKDARATDPDRLPSPDCCGESG
jgi:type I restriction enzyme M protein